MRQADLAATAGEGGRAWIAIAAGALALVALAIVLVTRFAGDEESAPVVARSAPALATRAPVGLERGLILHAINPGSPATARLSLPGIPVRAYRVGAAIAPGIVLVAIGAGRVEIDANGRRIVLTIDPATGRPGDRAGLEPEPAAPSGELSGDEIARRIARQGQQVRRLPEEEAAGAPR